MSVRIQTMALCLVAALLSACTVPGTGPSPTGVGGPSEVASPLPTPSISSPPASPTPEQSDSVQPDDEETSANSSPSNPVISTRPGRSVLRLADVFDRGGWSEGTATPAGTSENVLAIYTTAACGFVDTIELRFGGISGSIEVSVAQGADSPSSDSSLEWSLIADGRTVDTTMITFKERRTLKARLDGVAAVKISVRGKSPCRGNMHALITQLIVIS